MLTDKHTPMKHFTITTQEQAEALRPYYCNLDGSLLRPTIGERVTPAANSATVTSWPDYPEEDAITFEECMSIVRDEVTEEVLRELGGDDFWSNTTYTGFHIADNLDVTIMKGTNDVVLDVYAGSDHAGIPIPNPTATKLRLLVAILRGE